MDPYPHMVLTWAMPQVYLPSILHQASRSWACSRWCNQWIACPLLIICYKVDPLDWGWRLPQSVDPILCKHLDSGTGWDSVGRRGKFIPRLCIYSMKENLYLECKNELLPLQDWARSSVVNLPPSGFLSAWGSQHIRGLSTPSFRWAAVEPSQPS